MIIEFVQNHYFSLEEVIERIHVADSEDLADVVQAVTRRYREQFPDWEVQFLALPKKKAHQIEYLQRIIDFLNSMEDA